jgi:single-stranded-DNA-specific exonuclease
MITAFRGVVNVRADKAGIIRPDSNHPQKLRLMLEKYWQIAPLISAEADANLGKYPPFLRQILFNRGFADEEGATRFLAGLSLEEQDPMQLTGMQAAVDRLTHAIQSGAHVVVYGDYDADGVTATALLVECLSALGANVRPYIPDRFEEGYSLNVGALQQLAHEGAQVVVTVDCGIRALPEAAAAKALGMDLIITDHHSMGPELPEAVAIINSKQPGDLYPEKMLAGVGTAYKLAQALATHFENSDYDPQSALDLVAVGTVADLVPLTGENRWLVRQGLQRLQRPTRQGLMSLMGVAGVKPEKVTAGDIGFMLGPRLNAAGRLDSALEAYKLLTTRDLFEAGKLAQDLDNRNRERQRMTRDMAELAEELAIREGEDQRLLTAVHADFNSGVVGLVASRLTENYYRPAIVGQHDGDFVRASCRSIAEFHITDALQECADLFENFGGHAAAAGFTVRAERWPEAEARLQTIAAEQLGGLDLRPTLHADLELPLADLKADLLNQLALLEPTGYGNPGINLVSRGLEVRSQRTVGKDHSHLKLVVSDGWVTYDAIAFRLGHWAQDMPKKIDLLYQFEMNEFNGRQSLQLNVRDLKPAGG